MKRKSQDDRPIMPKGKLTAVAVRNMKNPGLYGDGLGLYLQVSQWETKSWVFRFMLDGRARKFGLGAIHTVSLSEARQAALEARAKVRKGIDPIEESKAGRASKRLEDAKAMTFRQCAEAYIAANSSAWRNAKHAAQWTTTLETYAYPIFGALPVAAVDVGLVVKALEPIWQTKTETASRLRGRIEAVLDWATVRGYRVGENPARWKGHLAQILPAKSRIAPVKHLGAMAYVDLPPFMSDLRGSPGIVARALEFVILTACRTGEALGARWDEIDIARRIWVIPANRMKAKREHTVPLSDRALAILADLPRDGGGFVFPGAHANRPLSPAPMLLLLRTMRGPGPTVHGFRSTFRDWAGDATSFPRELAEQALAHAIGDKAEQAYRRGDALERRRKLTAAWARHCEGAPAGADNVVQLRERA